MFILPEAISVEKSNFEPSEGTDPVLERQTLSLWERAVQFLTSYDVFISYSHPDEEAVRYALLLAERLRKEKLDVFLDQYGTQVRKDLPNRIVRILLRSRMLVVIGTESNYKVPQQELGDQGRKESYVVTEIRLFGPTGRWIIPIELHRGYRDSILRGLLPGISATTEVGSPETDNYPCPEVIGRIVSSRSDLRAGSRRAIATVIALGTISLASIATVLAVRGLNLANTAKGDALALASDAERRKSTAEAGAKRAEDKAREQTGKANAAIVREGNAKNGQAEAEAKAKSAISRQQSAEEATAIAVEQKAIAKRESARQGRIAGNHSQMSNILNASVVDPVQDLGVVGKVYEGLLADRVPPVTSFSWIFDNLPKVPARLRAFQIPGNYVAGKVDSDGKHAVLVSEDKLVSIDVRTGSSKTQPFKFPSGWTPLEDARPRDFLHVDLDPRVSVFWADSGEPGPLLYMANQKGIRRLGPLADKSRIVDVAIDRETSAIACLVTTGASASVILFHDALAGGSKTFPCSNGARLSTAPGEGVVWLDRDKITFATFSGRNLELHDVVTPNSISFQGAAFFGIGPQSHNLELIAKMPNGMGVILKPDRDGFHLESKVEFFTRITATSPFVQSEYHRALLNFGYTWDRGKDGGHLPPIAAFYPGSRIVEVTEGSFPTVIMHEKSPSRLLHALVIDDEQLAKSRSPSSRPRFQLVCIDEAGRITFDQPNAYPAVFSDLPIGKYWRSTITANGAALVYVAPNEGEFQIADLQNIGGQYSQALRPLVTNVSAVTVSADCVIFVEKKDGAQRLFVTRIAARDKRELKIEQIDGHALPRGLPTAFQITGLTVDTNGTLYGLVRDNQARSHRILTVKGWESSSQYASTFSATKIPFEVHTALIRSHNGQILVADGSNGLWCWEGGQTKQWCELGTRAIAFDGRQNLWAVAEARNLLFFDQSGLGRSELKREFSYEILDIDFNSDAKEMLLTCADSRVRLFDVDSYARNLTIECASCTGAQFAGKNDDLINVSAPYSTMKIFDRNPQRLKEALWKRLATHGSRSENTRKSGIIDD